jgi:hypothetical protein
MYVQVVEGDLKSSLDVGTSWDEHSEHINKFVKLELTKKVQQCMLVWFLRTYTAI